MFFCSLPASGEGRTPSSPPLTHTSRGCPFPGQRQTFIAKWGHKEVRYGFCPDKEGWKHPTALPCSIPVNQLVLPGEGYISSTPMRTCRQPEIRMCLRAGP